MECKYNSYNGTGASRKKCFNMKLFDVFSEKYVFIESASY